MPLFLWILKQLATLLDDVSLVTKNFNIRIEIYIYMCVCECVCLSLSICICVYLEYLLVRLLGLLGLLFFLFFKIGAHFSFSLDLLNSSHKMRVTLSLSLSPSLSFQRGCRICFQVHFNYPKKKEKQNTYNCSCIFQGLLTPPTISSPPPLPPPFRDHALDYIVGQVNYFP